MKDTRIHKQGDLVSHKLRPTEKLLILSNAFNLDSYIVRRYNAVKDRYDIYEFKETELEKW